MSEFKQIPFYRGLRRKLLIGEGASAALLCCTWYWTSWERNADGLHVKSVH